MVTVVNTGTNYETQCCTSMGSTVTQQWYRCHGTKLNPSWSSLTGASFASTPEVWKSVILEWVRLWEYYGVVVTFNGMTSLLNFMRIYNSVQKFTCGGNTDEQRHTNVITNYSCVLGQSCTIMIPNHCCTCTSFNTAFKLLLLCIPRCHCCATTDTLRPQCHSTMRPTGEQQWVPE
jgi:hypothetical protein